MEQRHPEFRFYLAKTPNVVGWEGQVEADGQTQRILVLCESSFPQRSPYVIPLTEGLEIEDLSETGHQNPNKTMCLFTGATGPNGWHPENISIPEVVRRARVHFERTVRGEHTDIHEDWYDPLSRHRCEHEVIIPETMESWLKGATRRSGVCRLRPLPGGKTLVVEHLEPMPRSADEWSAVSDAEEHISGRWIRDRIVWRNLAAVQAGENRFVEFVTRLAARHPGDAKQPTLLINPSGTRPFGWLVACPLCKDDAESSSSFLTRVTTIDLKKTIYSRMPRHAPLARLRQSRVMFIGCGALGSAVLHDLVTGGLTNFVLVDPDVVAPENVLRHTASLRDLCRKKVDVLREAILARNPFCDVLPFPYDIFMEMFHGLRATLAETTDVIISTTADSIVNRFVNQYGLQHRIPVIFASVLGDGLGGRVFRVIRDKTPCFTCCAILQESFDGAFPVYTTETHQQISPDNQISYRGPAVPGIFRDINSVAGIVGRLTEQTLLETRGVPVEHDDLLGDHLLWSNRAGWEFARPCELLEQPYKRVIECPDCGTNVSEPLDAESKRRLMVSIARNEWKPDPWGKASDSATVH